MSAALAPALVISEGQRESLQVLARAQSAPHRQVARARVLLMAADGVANTRIADREKRWRNCGDSASVAETIR